LERSGRMGLERRVLAEVLFPSDKEERKSTLKVHAKNGVKDRVGTEGEVWHYSKFIFLTEKKRGKSSC